MTIRLLLAEPNAESLDLLKDLISAALCMVPLNIQMNQVVSRQELTARVVRDVDDLIFLDWGLAEADTPDLVREILHLNPRLRVITLLPLQLRQYRQTIWEAGACSSIPKEHLDQEWMSSALCLINRAMQREERIISHQWTVASDQVRA